jgi:tetratricopeptide (TPR) repeat protein
LILGAVFVMTSLRALSTGGSIIVPGVVLAFALLFHVQAVLLAPPYVFLLARRAVVRRNPAWVPLAGAVVAGLTVAAAAAAGRIDAVRHFLLPPVGTGCGYGIFSAAHLVDVLNQVTLLCPAWLLFAALALRRAFTTREDAATEDTGELVFGWCSLVPALLFLLLFNPELGMARDWDLYCFTVLGLLTPGLLALRHVWPRLEAGRDTGLLMPPALALSALIAAAWIGVNASPVRSVDRYRSILEYDLTNPGYAYESLSRHFEDNFDFTGHTEALVKAYETSRNPRYLAKLGKTYYTRDDLPAAAHYLRAALAARPDFEDARRLLVAILVKQGSPDEVIAACREGIVHSPTLYHFHFVLGEAYFKKGMIEEGLKAFDACSKLDPPPEVLRDMKRIIDATLEARKEDDRR